MAMNLGAGDGDEDEVVASINTTPLVDVMLVLLIIFLITVPVVTQNAPLSLPKESNIVRQTKPENIEISVNKDGDVFWNAQLLADNEALFNRLKKVAVMTPQPEVHIRGDRTSRCRGARGIAARDRGPGAGRRGRLDDRARPASSVAPHDRVRAPQPAAERRLGGRPADRRRPDVGAAGRT